MPAALLALRHFHCRRRQSLQERKIIGGRLVSCICKQRNYCEQRLNFSTHQLQLLLFLAYKSAQIFHGLLLSLDEPQEGLDPRPVLLFPEPLLAQLPYSLIEPVAVS